MGGEAETVMLVGQKLGLEYLFRKSRISTSEIGGEDSIFNFTLATNR